MSLVGLSRVGYARTTFMLMTTARSLIMAPPPCELLIRSQIDALLGGACISLAFE
jgi:hypothetical protein